MKKYIGERGWREFCVREKDEGMEEGESKDLRQGEK